MMALSRNLIMTCIGVIALQSACVEQSPADEVYRFGQDDRGAWPPIDVDDLPKYLNASKVKCSAQHSEIDVVWNSESGDWTAFDKYSSKGSFFTRVIRFAQFDDAIQIVKAGPQSPPVMKIGGEGVQQYGYLINALDIWTQPSDFPYIVPGCAARIFQDR